MGGAFLAEDEAEGRGGEWRGRNGETLLGLSSVFGFGFWTWILGLGLGLRDGDGGKGVGLE